MATPGDNYVDCTNPKSMLSGEQILRLVATYDTEGKPALRVYDAAGGGGGGGVFPTPVQRTPAFQRVTAADTIPAGQRSVTIANVGVSDGTVLGSTLKPGEVISFSAGMYDTLGEIEFDSSATEFTINGVS